MSQRFMPLRMLGRTGLMVSPIALGTVELGYTYGIGPRSLPSEEDAIDLLKEAVDFGINFFDTAHFYGSAQERIGKSGIAKIPGVVIVTKCGHDIEKKGDITASELEEMVRREVDQSRKILNMDTLTLVMVHGGTARQINSGMIVDIMKKLKDESKIAHCGISTRGVEAPLAAIDSGFFEALQVGFSIFDQRLRNGVLQRAFLKNVGILARSVLLKGSLTSANKFLPDELVKLKDGYYQVEDLAQSIGISVPSLALRFALSETAITSVLVGTNKKNNLHSALHAYYEGDLPQYIFQKIPNFAISDPEIVDPSHWPPTAVNDEKDGKKVIPHLRGQQGG